jgi:hypothetical protein
MCTSKEEAEIVLIVYYTYILSIQIIHSYQTNVIHLIFFLRLKRFIHHITPGLITF